ncbi:hypothetical protein R1sor_014993 [Riccia sorocarpa]|uniref:Major facilitator superfamily (MFS) profile domain-containing protein n=1 Tax=Riccia sorocarpa TaxID=122646 RepID=A0ABD3HH57_9MARC
MGFAERSVFERGRAVLPLAPLLLALLIYTAGYVAVYPSIVDIMLNAICPGQVECSEVLFLSGLQITVSGIGAVLLAPIIGGLADLYGRKPVFLFVLGSSAVPSLILAYSREPEFVYVWWGLNLLSLILKEAGLFTLIFAFVADVVPQDRQRAPAIGIAMSSVSVGILVGTLFARVMQLDQLLKMAAVLQIAASVIVYCFLIESHPMHISSKVVQVTAKEDNDAEKQEQLDLPLIPEKGVEKSGKSSGIFRFAETLGSFRCSKMLKIIALVGFLANLTETAIQSTLFYYLKAEFNYGKDEFANFLILIGIIAFLSQIVFYPLLAHWLGERGVLWVGLVGASINSYIYAFAWADWVPYLGCALGLFYALVPPALGTIVSRAADSEHQGRVQGLIASVKTIAVVVGPIIFTPLTAAFLSDNPPFHCPGFALAIGGTSMVVAFFISLALPKLSNPETSFETVIPTTDEDKDVISISTSGVDASGKT